MSPIYAAGSNLLEVFEHDCTHEIAIIALLTGSLSFSSLAIHREAGMSTAHFILYVCTYAMS